MVVFFGFGFSKIIQNHFTEQNLSQILDLLQNISQVPSKSRQPKNLGINPPQTRQKHYVHQILESIFCSLRQEQTSHKRHNTTRKAFSWIPPLTLELVREETEVRGSHWSFCAFPQAKVGAQMVFCSATMAQNWARFPVIQNVQLVHKYRPSLQFQAINKNISTLPGKAGMSKQQRQLGRCR